MQLAIANIVKQTYSILSDDQHLRQSPETFEEQRGNYPVRREFGAWTINGVPDEGLAEILRGMGFIVMNDE